MERKGERGRGGEMKVRRVLEYEGTRAWIDLTFHHNTVKAYKPFLAVDGMITEIVCREVPDGEVKQEDGGEEGGER